MVMQDFLDLEHNN